MNLFQLFKNVSPFVKPYKWLVFITLILTLIGSLMAQVNAIVLDWTVDEINDCLDDLDCESCPSADCDWEEDDEYYDDEDEDDDGIEVLCPYCHETVVFDEDEFLREDMLICPNCGKKIDPEDLEEAPDDDDDDDIKF